MAHATGRLEEERVVVDDEAEANRLRDKGAYGQGRGPGTVLDLLEAAYLVEEDRLTITDPDTDRSLSLSDLLALGAGRLERFETLYLVYRDYRARGVVVRRRDDGGFDGWSRGAAPPRQKPATLLAPRSEGDAANPGALVELATQAEGLGRGLLLGVVDEESDVTYYELGPAQIAGHMPDPAPERAPQATARLLRDRALLLDEGGLAEAGYGNLAGGQRFLSLAETHHLAENGLTVLDVDGNEQTPRDVHARARELHPEGPVVLQAYTWLRSLDLVPKTGLKFGVHYRVYKGPPGENHAPFLVHALPAEAPWTYREVARFVRLSHSVKKRPVLWSPDGAVTVTWTRP